jgi:uncharacterized protein YjbI with pentapeptide repeats
MDRSSTTTADPTRDTELQTDLVRSLPDTTPAEIGDSITLRAFGDRIKVTVLGVIDPAVVRSRGIKSMLASLQGGDEVKSRNLRCVAVKLRMRNLEDRSVPGITHTPGGGILYDSEGREYSSSGDSTENCPSVWAPSRGHPPKVMCDAFMIPQEAKPARYVLGIGSGPAGEWRLESQQNSVESEPAFSLKDQLQLLESGVSAWNVWREKHPNLEIHLASAKLRDRSLRGINLAGANLEYADFGGSDLRDANFSKAHARNALFGKASMPEADFTGCDLRDASFYEAYAAGAHFDGATMTKANLEQMRAVGASFRGADLCSVVAREASLFDADFNDAKLDDADFTGALLDGAILSGLKLHKVKLTGAWLRGANLQSATLDSVSAYGANLQNADLTGATIVDSDLSVVTLVNAKLGDAAILNTRVFGISAWNIEGQLKRQDEIIITQSGQPRVTVNDLEVANFVYLILNNQKIRNAIETVGSKGVLILGRFTERKDVLEAIKKEVSRLDLLPIVFDFERPTDRDLTETIMTLAGLSRFIVADITAPKSVPLESHATVPNYMVPFVPLIQDGEKPFSPSDTHPRVNVLGIDACVPVLPFPPWRLIPNC